MRNSIKKLGFSAVVMGLLASSGTFVQTTQAADMKTESIKATITISAASKVDLKDIKHMEFTALKDAKDISTLIRYDETTKKWMISTDQGKTWKESEDMASMDKFIDVTNATATTEAVKLNESEKGNGTADKDDTKSNEPTAAMKLVPSQEAKK